MIRVGGCGVGVNPREEIQRLAAKMEEKFNQHRDRGDPFRPSEPTFLLHRFNEEERELMDALRSKSNPSEVWSEVADLCNFAAMIAVNYERDWDTAYVDDYGR